MVAWVDAFEVAHAFEVNSLDFMPTFGLGKLEKHVCNICAFHERSKEVYNLWELLS
jgi:hypothetical protein